jgi:glycosyltransferase involved in cell wall biosynthesis
MSILFLATHNVQCGIATYTEQLRNALDQDSDIVSLPSKDQVKSGKSLEHAIDDFVERAKSYDVVHIQHEHGLFYGTGDEFDAMKNFGKLLSELAKIKTQTFVTFHSDPVFYTGFKLSVSPLHIVNFCASKLWRSNVAKWFQPKHNITAIVHTERTKKEFLKSTFHKDNITVIPHGVIDRSIEFVPIDHRSEVNLSIFGFISSYKGYHVALKALQLLPDNYKLICMGGRHPSSTGDEFTQILGEAESLDRGVSEHKLHDVFNLVYDRVSVTGFLESDEADKMHAKTSIALAPYTDKTMSGSGALTWSITSRRPTIASDIPSFKTLNDEYQCMHLFKTDAYHELAWSIKRVAEDVKYQQALITGADKYSQELSWDNIAKAHINLYIK